MFMCGFLIFVFTKRWDDAVEVLDAIIEEDEANSSARKRKIAIFKEQFVIINAGIVLGNVIFARHVASA